MQEFFEGLLTWLYQASAKFLPSDPFERYINNMSLQLPQWAVTARGWLNWLLPFRECLTILSYVITALALYYSVRVLLGWLRAVQ